MGVGRGAGALALLLATVLLGAGCQHQPDDEMARPTQTRTVLTRAAAPLPVLPHGASTYRSGRTPVVDGGRIHLDARTTIDVSPLRADEAVLTRGGTYFINSGELWFTAGGRARSTGFVSVARVVVSDDGRYLGLVDRNHGPSEPGGVPVAAAVVYDTTTGRAVLRSQAGMGKVRDDLARDYAAHPPLPLTFESGLFYAQTAHGTYRYPLGGSPPQKVE